MNRRHILLIYLVATVGLFMFNKLYITTEERMIQVIEIINTLLMFIGVISIIYLLSTIGDNFYEELYEIKDKALLSESASELNELKVRLEEYRKIAYNNHTKYDIDQEIIFINNRLKNEFK